MQDKEQFRGRHTEQVPGLHLSIRCLGGFLEKAAFCAPFLGLVFICR